MSTLGDINVVISATDEASGVIEKVNASLGDLSGAGLERANKSLKTFRDEMGKAEKNITTQKNALKQVETEYNKNTKGLNDNLKALKNNQSRVQNSIVTRQEELEKLKASSVGLDKNSIAFKDNAKAIKWTQTEIDGLQKQHKSIGAEIEKVNKDIQKNSDSVTAARKAVAEAEATYGKFAQKLPEVEAAQKKIDKAMNAEKWVNTGKSMKDVGGAIDDITKPLQFAAAGTLALGVASGKAAMDYETAFTGVRKTVDGTEEQLAAVDKGLKELSKTTPVSAAELANLAAVGGQLGIETGETGETILKFTKTMADMGAATNLTGEQGAAAMARFLNVMGESKDNVDRVGSSIVDLGNHTATSEAEIAEMALRMGKFGNTVGMNSAQVLGYSAALSSLGIEAQMGGSAIGRTWLSIQEAVSGGGESLEAFAKYAGVSAADFKKQWSTDPSGAFNSLIKGLSATKDLTKALGDLGIDNIQDKQAVMALANGYDLMTDCLNRSSKAYEENTALTNEANAAYNTVANKLKMAMNAVTNAGIEWGNVLLPEVQKGAEWIGKVGEALGNMSEGQKQATLTAGKFILVTGASTKAVASGAKTIGGLVEGIGKLKEVANAGGAAGKIASATLGLGKLGLAVGAVGVAAYGVSKAYDTWYSSQYKWSKGLAEGNKKISESLNKYKQLSTVQQEIKGLKLVIENPESSQEQVEQAKARLNEIRELLSKEYNLVINSDNSNLEETVETVRKMSENELKVNMSRQMDKLRYLQPKFDSYKENIVQLKQQQTEASNAMEKYSNLSSTVDELGSKFRETGDMQAYKQGLIDVGKQLGIAISEGHDAADMLDIINNGADGKIGLESLKTIGNRYDEITGKINSLTAAQEEYVAVSTEMANWSNELLGMGAKQGNSQMVEENLKRMGQLIRNAGLDMAGYAQAAALAMNGVDSLNTAWEKGGDTLNGVVNDYIRAMNEFGASAQDTTVGAALIQNGFTDVGQAAAKGDEAVKGVLRSIKSIGQQQGLFDGLNADEISGKINDIAHAIGLLPKGKQIRITADGNIDIIDRAKQAADELNKKGNIKVKIDVDGNVELLSTADEKLKELVKNNEVDIKFNFDTETSDILDKAGNKIGEITVDGKVIWTSDTTEPDNYTPKDKPATAIYSCDSTEPDGYQPKDKTATVYYKVEMIGGGILNNRVQGKTWDGKVKENAKGTQNFSGGLAMVNDEEGVSDNRELIIDGGRAFIPHGRNVILPLSRGAKVYTARQTKRIMTAMGIPHYAQGKDNSEAFTTAKDDWTHYTKTHAVTITQELEKWVELSEKFKDNQKDIEDIEEEIYSLTVKQNDERNKASEKWADKRIFNNDWEEYGDDIYSAYDRIKVRNMEMVSSGKMTWDDYAEYMESAGEKMYDSRRDQSEKWLEHEKKYNNLSEDDYGAGLRRMQEYTLQMYEQGIINHEKMREEMQNIDEKYFDFVSEKNANEYSSWQNDADMWEKMRDTYGDWEDYSDSKLDFIKRKIEKVEDFYKNGKISFDEYDIATKNYQMDYYNEQSRIYDEKLQEFSSRISKLREKYSDAEQKLQDSWTVSDRKENIEDLQNQIAMYRNATTHAGQEKLKSLESQLKDAQRQQQLYELQQSNNKVLTQMQSQYDYLEENKAAKLRELMKSTVDIAKLEANMSSQIAAAKNALNSDSLRQYNVLRDIYSAIKGLRLGASYTDSRTINNYKGEYNPKGVWSIVNGIAVGGMGSFVF